MSAAKGPSATTKGTWALEAPVLPRILRASSDSVTLVTLDDGRLLDANESFERMSGWSREDAIGRTTVDLGIWPEPDDRREHIDELIRHSGLSGALRVVVTRAGERRVVEMTSHLTDVRGERCVLTLSRDVTGVDQADEAFRRTLARNRAFLDAFPDLVFLVDRDGRLLDYKAGREDLLVDRPLEWLGRKLTDVLPPQVAFPMALEIEEALAGGEVRSVEYDLPGLDGRLRHWEARLAATSGGEIVALVRDITERRRAEQALRDSEERFRLLSDATAEGVAIHEDGRILDANIACAAMLGYERHEIIGKTALELTAPQSHPEILRHIREGSEEPYEVVGVRRDGTTLPIAVRGLAIPWQGRTVRIVALRDLSERKLAEQELRWSLEMHRQAAERLVRLDGLKTTLIRAVSHELRTPLTAILWVTEALDRGDLDPSSEQGRSLLAEVTANARTLDRLLTDLLDTDRLKGGRRASARATDLRALVAGVVEAFSATSGRPVEFESVPISAAVDAILVERIVQNLLTNADMYAPVATPIEVGLAVDAGGILLRVDDRGPGVRDEDKERIFQPFQRGSADLDAGSGMGIGLTLVRRFAELHGGRAWVEDRPDGGASFRALIPASPTLLLPEDEQLQDLPGSG